MITWKEAKGTEVLCNIEDSPEELRLKLIKYPGLEVKMKRNEVNKGEQILGVRLALDGNDEAEFNNRKDQARELAGKIRSSPFFTRRCGGDIQGKMDPIHWILPPYNSVHPD